MSNAMILRTPGEGDIRAIQMVAKEAYKSGLYKNLGSEAAIVMISMAAYELGIPYFMALSGGINVIQGKAEISARTLNALLLRDGHKIHTIKHDETGCWLKGIRGDTGTTYEASFTMKDADDAGLSSKDVWKKYRKDMLWARAVSRLARIMGPDTIGHYYVEGEIKGELVKDSCEVIESDIISQPKDEPKEFEEKVHDLSCLYEGEWCDIVKDYVTKYCYHYKKTFSEFMDCHTDKEQLLSTVQKWWEKKNKKAIA